MRGIKLVCFDIDGTLVEGNSWLMLTQGLGCSPDDHLSIFHKAQDGEISFKDGERLLIKMYQDAGKANKKVIKKIYDAVDVRKEAFPLVSYLKKKGYKIYLISGAIDWYVEAVSKKLKVDGFYANSSLIFRKDGNLDNIIYRAKQGELKLQQLQELIKKEKIGINQCSFIGDSENDIEVFKATKHGIAVRSGSEELKRVAWKIVDSLSKVKAIL